MRTQTRVSRSSSAFGKRFSLWPRVDLLLEKRRRKRAAVARPNAPVITSGTYDTATDIQWFDGVITFTFQHGTFPTAMLEVWFNFDYTSYVRLATIPSTATTYRHARAAQGEDSLRYQLRYVSNSIVGRFSNEYEIVITF